MTLPRKNDILFAHKAVNLMPGLGDAAKRVAGALIDHFNKKDGRCHPGVDRLCKLLGLNRATVLRATKALHELKIISKTSHGGPYHQASYQPNWDYLRCLVKEWDERMITLNQDPTAEFAVEVLQVENVENTRCPNFHSHDGYGRKSATQTHAMNQSKKTVDDNVGRTISLKPASQSKSLKRGGLLNGTQPSAQRSLLLPFNGGYGLSRREVSRQVAQKRWENDARSLGERSYAAIVEWVTEERQEAATDAELHAKGGGLRFIRAAMAGDPNSGSHSSTPCDLVKAHPEIAL